MEVPLNNAMFQRYLRVIQLNNTGDLRYLAAESRYLAFKRSARSSVQFSSARARARTARPGSA